MNGLDKYQLHDRSSLSRFTRCFDQAYLVTFRSKKLIIWITCSVVCVMSYSSQTFGFLVYQVFSRSHPPWDPNVFWLVFFLYDLTCMGCRYSSPSFWEVWKFTDFWQIHRHKYKSWIDMSLVPSSHHFTGCRQGKRKR